MMIVTRTMTTKTTTTTMIMTTTTMKRRRRRKRRKILLFFGVETCKYIYIFFIAHLESFSGPPYSRFIFSFLLGRKIPLIIVEALRA